MTAVAPIVLAAVLTAVVFVACLLVDAAALELRKSIWPGAGGD